MRRLVTTTILAAALAAPGLASAQQPPRAPRAPAQTGPVLERRAAADFLLKHRAELGLSDEQVRQIERIAADLVSRNHPLLQQLEEERAGMMAPALAPQMRNQGDQQARTPRPQMRERLQRLPDSTRQRVGARQDSVRLRMLASRDSLRSLPAEERRERVVQMQQMARQQSQEHREIMAQVRNNTAEAMHQIQAALTVEQRAELRSLMPDPPLAPTPAPAMRRGPGDVRGPDAVRAPRHPDRPGQPARAATARPPRPTPPPR